MSTEFACEGPTRSGTCPFQAGELDRVPCAGCTVRTTLGGVEVEWDVSKDADACIVGSLLVERRPVTVLPHGDD